MLINAFNKNYDIAILFAGDEDYVNLVQEVKRYGTIIIGSFLEKGLTPNLRRTFDHYYPLQIDEKHISSLKDIEVRNRKNQQKEIMDVSKLEEIEKFRMFIKEIRALMEAKKYTLTAVKELEKETKELMRIITEFQEI